MGLPAAARAETSSVPVVTLVGVRAADENVRTADVDAYASRLTAALQNAKNFRVVTPNELDTKAGGRVARTAILDSIRPGPAIASAPPGLLGDRALLITVQNSEKRPLKADLYGTSDGTLYLSVFATAERPLDLIRAISIKLQQRRAKKKEASDLVKLTVLAPESAAPDWPLTIEATVDPAEKVSLSVYTRQEGTGTFEHLAGAAISQEVPGTFAIHLRPMRSGPFAYYVVAMQENPDGSDNIACTVGTDEAPLQFTVEERDTELADLAGTSGGSSKSSANAAPKLPPERLSIPEPPGLRVPPPVPTAPRNSNPAIAATAFSLGAAGLVLGAIFTVRTLNSVADRRTCYTVSSCEAKTSALNLNQSVAWGGYGLAAVGVGVGGLAVALQW